MKKSDVLLKSWSKESPSRLVYYLSVFESGKIEFFYESPTWENTNVTTFTVDAFFNNQFDPRIKQYLGDQNFKEIIKFIELTFKK